MNLGIDVHRLNFYCKIDPTANSVQKKRSMAKGFFYVIFSRIKPFEISWEHDFLTLFQVKKIPGLRG